MNPTNIQNFSYHQLNSRVLSLFQFSPDIVQPESNWVDRSDQNNPIPNAEAANLAFDKSLQIFDVSLTIDIINLSADISFKFTDPFDSQFLKEFVDAAYFASIYPNSKAQLAVSKLTSNHQLKPAFGFKDVKFNKLHYSNSQEDAYGSITMTFSFSDRMEEIESIIMLDLHP